jgi:hypothetical protein
MFWHTKNVGNVHRLPQRDWIPALTKKKVLIFFFIVMWWVAVVGIYVYKILNFASCHAVMNVDVSHLYVH